MKDVIFFISLHWPCIERRVSGPWELNQIDCIRDRFQQRQTGTIGKEREKNCRSIRIEWPRSIPIAYVCRCHLACSKEPKNPF